MKYKNLLLLLLFGIVFMFLISFVSAEVSYYYDFENQTIGDQTPYSFTFLTVDSDFSVSSSSPLSGSKSLLFSPSGDNRFEGLNTSHYIENGSVSLNFNYNPSNAITSIYFRYQDSNNYYHLYYLHGLRKLSLIKFVGGVQTSLLLTSALTSPSGTCKLSVSFNGTTIKPALSDCSSYSDTITDSSFSDGYVAIMGYDGSGRDFKIDNLNITDFTEEEEIVSNFTITAQDIYTNSSINNFSIEIDGTNYTTTTGTVTTHILQNDTSLYNFTVFNVTDYFNRTFTNINVSENYEADLYPAFEVSVYNEYTNETFNTFNLTLGNSTYNTSTGLIKISDLNNPLGEYTFNISGDFYNLYYEDYNISSNLNASAKQTNITFNFVFDSGDLLNFSNILIEDLNNSINQTISTGTINFNPSSENITFRFSNADNIFDTFNYTVNLTLLENSTYNISIIENQNILTFNDINSSSPIDNANVTITYPSGKIIYLMTNSSGQVNFSYDYDGSLEFGEYIIKATKLTYLNFTTTETITNTDVPFYATYNVSRAVIVINIYDRETHELLTGVNVSLTFFGLFNDTTTTGQLVKDNLSIVTSDYTVYARADGYLTEVRRFTFNNQEEVEIDFYLINLTQDNAGTLFVSTINSFYEIITGTQVELLEYSDTELSYIVVSECITNANGECSFGVELNDKSYYLRAFKTIDGDLYTAETSQSGEIIVTDNEVRTLVLYFTDRFTVLPTDNILIDITESFNNNISSIQIEFKTTDGSSKTLCLEYFSNGVSVTGDTYCVTSAGAIQNIDVNFLLNRSNRYVARIYLKNSYGNTLLEDYIYPSISDIELILDSWLIRVLILFFWIGILALSLYLKNITFYAIMVLFLAWGQRLIFPLVSITQVSVFITFLGAFIIWISRKRLDTE